MMNPKAYILYVCAGLMLAACDIVRFPGDGGPPPETPEAGPELPDGAPGPPPPTEVVVDPYNNGDTDTSDNSGPAPDPSDTQPNTDDPASNPQTDPLDADAPDADTTPSGSDEVDADTDASSGTDTSDDDGAPTDTDTDTDTDTEAGTNADSNATDTADTVTPAPTPVFSYNAPGQLLPGSGRGDTDQIVHAPDIVFPIKSAPTYLQSMVFTYGGGIGGGDQCDPRNYAYPWRDNFCETRSANRNSPFCPTARIHQGQDIRVGTPEDCNTLRRTSAADRAMHEVVAVEDGIISNIGTYSVNVRAGGHIYKYMHMNMKKLEVTAGQTVAAGQTLGYVSNDFGGTPTTFHLHFEIVENTAENGWSHVPPYLSLVEAYERRENGPGEEIEPNVAVASAPVVIPEGFEIIE